MARVFARGPYLVYWIWNTPLSSQQNCQNPAVFLPGSPTTVSAALDYSAATGLNTQGYCYFKQARVTQTYLEELFFGRGNVYYKRRAAYAHDCASVTGLET